MSDPTKFFENLDDQLRYPGGIPPRRAGQPVAPPPAGEADWDAKPTVMHLKGEETEFFTIGDLARALDRKPVAIRKWESQGRLPYSRFRAPAPKKGTLEGKKPMGRRLYTRHQIEVVIKAAAKAGVTDPEVKRPNWEIFTNAVVDGWKQDG